MAKTRIGSLNVALTLNSKKFTAGVTFAQKKINRFTTSVAKMGAKIFFIREAMQTAGAAFKGMAGDIPGAIAKLDELATTAAKLGIGTQELQGLRNAARLTGVEINTFDMALQRAARRIAEAGVGTGEAQGALRELGLDAAKLTRLPLEKQFYAIAQAMSHVERRGDKIRLAMKLFDSEGVAVVNTLDLGEKSLKRHVDYIKALGPAYGEGAQQASKFVQEMLRANIVQEGQEAQTAAGLAKAATGPWQRVTDRLNVWRRGIITAAAGVGTAGLRGLGGFTEVVDQGFLLDVSSGLGQIYDQGMDFFSKRGTHAGEATVGTAANLPGGPTGAGQGPMLAAIQEIVRNTRNSSGPETQ